MILVSLAFFAGTIFGLLAGGLCRSAERTPEAH